MCCEGLRTTGGVVGVMLLLVGGLQIGIGIYYLLADPGFLVASNVWTGLATGLAGVCLMYFGYTKSATRRSNCSFLALNIICLLANILNIVVIQVGENLKFLTEEKTKILQHDSEAKFMFDLGIYSSTIISSGVLVTTFGVSQYLFYGHLRKPKFDRQIAFIEPSDQEKANDIVKGGSRFFPPSRLVAKENVHSLPAIEDVIVLPETKTEANNQYWVYKNDDKISQALYPLGLELHPQNSDLTNRQPVRHSSFVTPRYARVRHRPQRAQSFGNPRYPFSLHGDKNPQRPLPVSIPRLHDISLNDQKIQKSNSFAFQSTEGAITLSKKYHCFTQNRDVNFSVIEVGSLKSASSLNSLHCPVTNFPTEVIKENQLSQIKSLTLPRPKVNDWSKLDDNNLLKPSSFHRLMKTKGPAPLPPSGKSSLSYILTDEQGTLNLKCKAIQEQQVIEEEKEIDSHIEEELLTITERDKEKEKVHAETSFSFEDDGNGRQMEEENEISTILNEKKFETLDISYKSLTRCESNSKIQENTFASKETSGDSLIRTLNKERSNKDNFDHKQINTSTKQKYSRNTNLKTQIISNDKYEKNSFSVKAIRKKEWMNEAILKHTKYEKVHREIMADTKLLLDMVPNGEFQTNKIILRVPSFKTTGCQTEFYRPLRRRASCSQGNISINPKYLPSKEMQTLPHPNEDMKNNMTRELNVGSSSSSGYSSPEGGSKYTSPIHSGPPSPSSSYETMTEENPNKRRSDRPNITIIEINKLEKVPFYAYDVPKYHPNFISHSISCKNKHVAINEYIRSEQFRDPDDETDSLSYAEAINPMVGTIPEDDGRVPRIIDAIYKPSHISNSRNGNHFRNINALPSSHNHYYQNLSFRRKPTYTNSSPSLLETQSFQLSSIAESTSAYLTSLERLAYHYRDKAIKNAKQLEIQQTFLEQESFRDSQANMVHNDIPEYLHL